MAADVFKVRLAAQTDLIEISHRITKNKTKHYWLKMN